MTSYNKKRINLSVDDDLVSFLSALAKKEGKPIATKVMDLVNFALEFEEDQALLKIAEQRASSIESRKYLSHDIFWKKALKRTKHKQVKK